MPSVVQPWVSDLTLMQQSVLFTAIRGPDGIHKNHVSKKLARWLRRCVLIAAFDKIVYEVPFDPPDEDWRSGSFTGPSVYREGPGFCVSISSPDRYDTWQDALWEVLRQYVGTLDELPHHYQLHILHAAEILGYKHPTFETRDWWHRAYHALVNDMHLMPESEAVMDTRLGDSDAQWRAAEKGMTADV